MWFLLIPPVALVVALVWVAMRSRPDRSSEAMITIAGYRRSMAALARPIPPASSTSDRRGAVGGDAFPFAPEGGGRSYRPDPDERIPHSRDGYGPDDRFWSDRDWSEFGWSDRDWLAGDWSDHGLADSDPRDHRLGEVDLPDRDPRGRDGYDTSLPARFNDDPFDVDSLDVDSLDIDPLDVDSLDVDDTYLLSPVTGPIVLDDLQKRPRPRPEGSE
ncbi:hypothetical protein MXD59_08265 [Frankia sp. Ag45/Mut15]|uniref:Secreted protein n=1 Tax=Frankia umida TaxID=573489 RepID=A0ABT0JW55_9ACTN|nr:hypothetical protein [Frankia umida]MCK9875767.1 hypothetical protein [Frankia umida]